jgi:hypothetical protein
MPLTAAGFQLARMMVVDGRRLSGIVAPSSMSG